LKYKELLWQFAFRDFKVRYVSTYLGSIWAIVNPLISVLILSFVFGNVAKIGSHGVPHLLFTMSAMVVWTYFSSLVGEGSNSILAASHMIKKIYFPKIILPIYKMMNAFVELIIAITILIILFIVFKQNISLKIFYAPIFILSGIVASLGVSIIASVSVVKYRDLQHLIPHIVRLGVYISPIAYPASLVSQKYQWLYFLNPIAGVIEGFRWSLFENYPFSQGIYISIIASMILLILGIIIFSKFEKEIVDLL
jgi:lipopolysaccharide transport system permease protein